MTIGMSARFAAVLACALLWLCQPVLAAETSVAVAANFTEPAQEIAAAFKAETGHEAVLSFGSTGQLFAQIGQDAPYDILLAADRETPEKAIAAGLGIPGSAFTYAVGRLVLWSAGDLVKGADTLKAGGFARIAIANPERAPYGAAAVETMTALGVADALRDRTVQGNNIAQAYQFVASGNAELGFVALSQVARSDTGSRWVVPDELHAPIRQGAVLLRKGQGKEAAEAFLAFLKSATAGAIIKKYGYGVESAN